MVRHSVSAHSKTTWWHPEPSEGRVMLGKSAGLGGKKVPMSLFLSMKLKGRSFFSSLPFFLM